MSADFFNVLLSNIHENLKFKSHNTSEFTYVSGKYDYYHYGCDGFDDKGWGCGYRTLQTLCSWINHSSPHYAKVPTIKEIQDILVRVEDKPDYFIGSKQWIGSFEVCLVLDHLYNVSSKIIHSNKGENLEKIVQTIKSHFQYFGSPIMMGGDMDASSKGVVGICTDVHDESYLLIVDPHYVGETKTKEFLQNKGWVKWQPLSDFNSNSFYNLCLPQVKSKHLENVS